MAIFGTLLVSDPAEVDAVDEFDSFKVSVAVRKPDFDLLAKIEKSSLIVLLFEAVATLNVIAATRSALCFLFLIPAIVRYVSVPKTWNFTNTIPSFIVFHSIVILVEMFVIGVMTAFCFYRIQMGDGSAWLTSSLAALSFLLLVRFLLTALQHRHYNRMWMSSMLARQQNYLFNVV